jgi:hypothetical protein
MHVLHTHTQTHTKFNILSLGGNSSVGSLTRKHQVAANIAVKGTYVSLGYTACNFTEESYTCAYTVISSVRKMATS